MCEIGENLLSVSGPISQPQERLIYAGALVCPRTSTSTSVTPTSIRSGGKSARCNVPGARATTSIPGAYIITALMSTDWCNGCQRTFNDLTNTLLHQSKRLLPFWILAAFLLCLSCSSRRIARS